MRALDGVSFRIERGSITALVGPNGAGKTTLMRCLAGLDQPLAGSIQVADIDVIEEPRRSHRLLGYLSDSFGLYDTLSVRRSLSYVAQANGIEPPAVDRVVTEISAALGLAERLELPAGQLSAGSASGLPLRRPSSIRLRLSYWTSRLRDWIRKRAWISASSSSICAAAA